MKSPDEIKKGLECCAMPLSKDECDQCPYRPGTKCTEKNADALSLIQQLESDKQQLEGLCNHMNQLRDAAAGRALKMEERVHQLEAERDAAVKDMHRSCFICKNFGRSECLNTVCAKCVGWCNWQWRGVQKEE